MHILNAYWRYINPPEAVPELLKIEFAYRECYKSEGKMAEVPNVEFIRNKINIGHLSPLEHVAITVEIICDRGVSHELVRHRIASFSQECIVGNTKIKKNLTVQELYNKPKQYQQMTCIKSINNEGQVILNRVAAVFRKGIQDVYKVITDSGYEITCTMEHKFLSTGIKYIPLKNLQIGDIVLTNGRPCLIQISDEELTNMYDTYTPQDIAEVLKVPCHTIYRKLKKLRIFEKHKNDYDQAKYTKNHTEESYDKMSETIQQQYNDGREVWNKGITEDMHPSVAAQGEALRAHHYNNKGGENNSNWKTGISVYREYKRDENCCEFCGEDDKLEVHHLDENRDNNDVDNLVKVCITCHGRLHHGWYVGKSAFPSTITSIEYIGKEETYDIEMEAPYHNYVANGFIVHNSTRYCNYSGNGLAVIDPCFWDPSSFMYRCPTSEAPKETAMSCREIWYEAMKAAEIAYNKLISLNASPQEARSVLPNSTKTAIVVTQNIRQWRHFFRLRALGMTGKPHPQMIELALPMMKAFKKDYFPLFENLQNENE